MVNNLWPARKTFLNWFLLFCTDWISIRHDVTRFFLNICWVGISQQHAQHILTSKSPHTRRLCASCMPGLLTFEKMVNGRTVLIFLASMHMFRKNMNRIFCVISQPWMIMDLISSSTDNQTWICSKQGENYRIFFS